MFSKFVNCVPIDLKIGTPIAWTYTMYIAKKCIDPKQRNTCFHGNQLSNLRHKAFFKTFTFFISTNNEDIGQKFFPDT